MEDPIGYTKQKWYLLVYAIPHLISPLTRLTCDHLVMRMLVGSFHFIDTTPKCDVQQ